MIQVFEKLFTKLSVILQTLQGWLLALGIFLAEYFFATHGTVVKAVLIVTILDAVWGIAVSIKRGEFTLSELMRLTVAKIAVYGSALAAFIQIDIVANTELCTDIVSIPILLCESWSMAGSMLIINPQMPILRLLKKALTGEIANKLRMTPEEVEQVFAETKSANKTANKTANGNANGNANEDETKAETNQDWQVRC